MIRRLMYGIENQLLQLKNVIDYIAFATTKVTTLHHIHKSPWQLPSQSLLTIRPKVAKLIFQYLDCSHGIARAKNGLV